MHAQSKPQSSTEFPLSYWSDLLI